MNDRKKTALYKNCYSKCLFMLFLLLFIHFNTNESSAKNHAQLATTSLANTISGFVFDEQRNPIGNIFVELQDELYRSISRGRTDGSGRYFFSGMRDGRYVIKVIGAQFGYEEQIVTVEIVNLNFQNNTSRIIPEGNDNVQQDIYLRLRKNSSNNNLVTGVIFAQDIPKDAQSSYEKGILLLSQNKEAEGIDFLQKSIKTFPNYFAALNRLGYEYLKKENFAQASKILAKAADINPNEAILYLLAYSLHLDKDYDVAIEVLNGAIKLHGSSQRLYTTLGASLRLKNKYKEAEDALKKARNLDGKYPEARWQLALLYGNNLNKFEEAAEELEMFLKLQPESQDKEKIKELIRQFREKRVKQK